MLLVAMFISLMWGISPIIYKHVLKSLDTYSLIALQGAFYIALYTLYLVFMKKHISQKRATFTPKVIAWVGVAAIFGMILPTVLFFAILKNHDSHIITALTYSSPMFTLLIAYFILHEKVTLMSFLGVVLIVAGIMCISLASK